MNLTRALGTVAILAGLSSFASASAPAGEAAPYRFGLGINVGGGQVDWRLNPRWMLEARFQTGSDDAADKTTTHLYGLRAYRFLSHRRPSFFSGLELAHTASNQANTSYRTTGYAGGAFIGLELRLIPHVFFMADAGPYVISQKERRTGVSEGSMAFVGDLAVVVGF